MSASGELIGGSTARLGVVALLAALSCGPAVAAEVEHTAVPVPSASEPEDSETPVDIPDAVLRKAVEVALGKPSGDAVTQGEMATLGRLSATGVGQLTGIEYAVNLSSLVLSAGTISDLVPLASLTSLTYIDLGSNAVEDVSPLVDLTSLTELHLTDNAIADISPLARMTRLKTLQLGGNKVGDVSPLADLTSLTTLGLQGAGVTVLAVDDGWRWYTEINDIADVAPLAGLTSLTYLDLSYNKVANLRPLADLTSLTHLYLGSNEVVDATPLAGLTLLRRLELRANRMTDLSPLADLKSLVVLGLASVGGKLPNRPPPDLSPLSGLTSLTWLYLDSNKLRDLSPLEGLKSLRHLSLQANYISDLSPLGGLTSLKGLDLYGNQPLSDLSPLSSLRSLEWMQLGNCGTQLRDVSPLASLTSAVSLWLPGNGIVDPSPFADLTYLRDLNLGGNHISDVSSLAGLTSLTSLKLWNSRISDVSPLLHNTGLGEGDVLDLRGNPLNKTSIDTVIPQLIERGVEVAFEQPELPEGWEPMDIADSGFRAALERRLVKGEGWWIAKEEVAQLQGLAANESAIEDLAGIEAAQGLERLDATGNAISNLAPLAGSSLRLLFLDGNDIEDVGALAGLSWLRALTLSGNEITDVAPLADLGGLTYLALDGNSLTDIPALPASLRHLHLADNDLSDITALSTLRLDELRLSGNAVASLEPLVGQPLRYLHLNRNRVADLAPLNIASLVELHAKDNAVRDLSPLVDGEALRVVDVRGNPLPEDAMDVLESLRVRDTTVLAGETVPYFPAAGDGRQGFVRVVNHSDEAGDVFIEAVDDAGFRAGPVRLELGARRVVHFNSTDLEGGNAAKGLGAIGTPTAGDWRLSLISALDVEVLSYVRTEDGFVTAMHDVAADALLPTFNPGSNDNQRSVLRVVNTEAGPAKWTTGGYDDRGKWHPMVGSIEVRPDTALTLSAAALENTHGLGDGRGKWRLRVRGFPWFAMSLLASPTGHVTNLSTAPDHSTPLPEGGRLHRLPLFPAASGAQVGFARVINRSASAGRVAIEAVDDRGTRLGPVTLDIAAGATMHFNSRDLEGGNAAKGLSGGVGVGEGHWRLELASTLNLQVLSYIRTADGFLTSMHDLVPRTEDGSLWVPFFNPGSNSNQVSSLRLMNWGAAPAEASIAGVDDAGQPSHNTVRVTIPARSARTFTASELEAGDAAGLSGSLGDGQGKWRLRVATTDEVDAMSLLSLPTGHMTNLSTTPRYPTRQQL